MVKHKILIGYYNTAFFIVIITNDQMVKTTKNNIY